MSAKSVKKAMVTAKAKTAPKVPAKAAAKAPVAKKATKK